MSRLVELRSDQGEAAVDNEFFRSAEFYAVEGVTHTLLFTSERESCAIPVIVREIPQGGRDAVSPYGYPGGCGAFDPVTLGADALAGAGLVSIFVRDRLGSPTLAGGNPRSTVLLHDPRKPRQVRATTTNNVRRNIDLGFTTSTTVGPDLDEDALAQFTSCYRETMTRVAAATRNLYDADYLRACLSFPRSWLVATHAPGGGFAAGMLLVRSDDTLHYYLGGTTDAHLDRSPVRNAFLAAMDLADSLGLPLNFGGGIHPGDGLEKFKRGFSNAEATFTTHEIVADVKAYARLSGEEPNAAFFPAYRAPA